MKTKPSNNLSYVKLGEIALKIGSGATPRGGKESYKDTGISLIRSLNVYDFKFDYDGLAFIDEKQAQQLANVEVKLNDILLNITGASVARCCLVPSEVLPARVNQHVAIVRINPNLANPLYVLYCINSPYYKNYLLTLAQGGATREALTKDTVSNFEIPLPSLLTQTKIVSVLSAYDDLIENNTRRIKILEEMAQTLYHEWFVKFRFPGHEQVKMVESELGLIPEGWENAKLGEIASFQTGKLNANAAIPNGLYPFFTCSQEISRTNTYSFDTECVLLAGNNANGIFHIKYFNGKFDVYQRTYIIRTLQETKVTNYYLYFAIKEQLEHLKSISTGAATKFLTLTILNNLNISLSNVEIQQKFASFISAVFSQIEILQTKNANLQKTRDLLLPKLISGEIDVEKLEIDIGNIAA